MFSTGKGIYWHGSPHRYHNVPLSNLAACPPLSPTTCCICRTPPGMKARRQRRQAAYSAQYKGRNSTGEKEHSIETYLRQCLERLLLLVRSLDAIASSSQAICPVVKCTKTPYTRCSVVWFLVQCLGKIEKHNPPQEDIEAS